MRIKTWHVIMVTILLFILSTIPFQRAVLSSESVPEIVELLPLIIIIIGIVMSAVVSGKGHYEQDKSITVATIDEPRSKRPLFSFVIGAFLVGLPYVVGRTLSFFVGDDAFFFMFLLGLPLVLSFFSGIFIMIKALVLMLRK